MLERTRIRKERHRQNRHTIRTVIAVVVVIALWSIPRGAVRKEHQVVGYEYITGTSLWDLSRNCPEEMDKRDYIAEIIALNAMSSTIVCADKLYQVPVYEK